jgi:hypothetical protein
MIRLYIIGGWLVLVLIGAIVKYFTDPRCPNCKKGRIRTDSTHKVDEKKAPGGFFYYGIPLINITTTYEKKDRCSKCDYVNIKRWSDAVTYA